MDGYRVSYLEGESLICQLVPGFAFKILSSSGVCKKVVSWHINFL
jgi:hypothetical protein